MDVLNEQKLAGFEFKMNFYIKPTHWSLSQFYSYALSSPTFPANNHACDSEQYEFVQFVPNIIYTIRFTHRCVCFDLLYVVLCPYFAGLLHLHMGQS